MCLRHEAIHNNKIADTFIFKKYLLKWMTLKKILAEELARIDIIDNFSVNKKYQRTLVQWLEWSEKLREYSVLLQIAEKSYKSLLIRNGFRNLYILWTETSGLRRIKFAIRVQSLWRGKKGRRRFANMKALEAYKVRVAKKLFNLYYAMRFTFIISDI